MAILFYRFIEQLILDAVPVDIPILFEFPAGHEADNSASIFGRTVQLAVSVDSKQYSVVFKD